LLKVVFSDFNVVAAGDWLAAAFYSLFFIAQTPQTASSSSSSWRTSSSPLRALVASSS
jgi:hypothetical protein